MNSSGTTLRRYVPGQGVDETLVWYEGSGLSTPAWLHTDQQGSVVAASDSSGVSATTYAYGPFGEGGISGGPPNFRYTGQVQLAAIGVYYYKARMYDPVLGRFLQTDQAGYSAGMNLYAYVMNNPANATDPSGMWDTCSVLINDVEVCRSSTTRVGTCANSASHLTNQAASSLACQSYDESLRVGLSPVPGEENLWRETPSARVPPKPSKSDAVAKCESEAYLALMGNLALDAVGLIPGGDAAAAITKIGAMSVQGALLAANPNARGGVLLAGGAGV
jgi:RHS repeat-associated protein